MLEFEFTILPQESLEVKRHLQQNWLPSDASLTLKAFHLFAKIILFPKTAFDSWKFNKDLDGEKKQSIKTILLIDEDGFNSRSSVVESSSDWSEISRWAETDKTIYFLSLRSKGETGYIYILPKRILTDNQRLLLKDLIKQNFKDQS